MKSFQRCLECQNVERWCLCLHCSNNLAAINERDEQIGDLQVDLAFARYQLSQLIQAGRIALVPAAMLSDDPTAS